MVTRATWEQLVTRLTGVAERNCENKGFAIVSINILVDATGQPVFWTEPEVTKLEPRIGAGAFMHKVMTMLSKTAV